MIWVLGFEVRGWGLMCRVQASEWFQGLGFRVLGFTSPVRVNSNSTVPRSATCAQGVGLGLRVQGLGLRV